MHVGVREGNCPVAMEDSPDTLQPSGTEAPAAGIAPTGDAPSRVHLAIALVGGLTLIAVPLLLWVGPTSGGGDAPAASASASNSAPVAPVASVDPSLDGLEEGTATKGVELGKVWIDQCQKPGPGRTPAEQCDRQPWFEEALVRAIHENSACAPEKAGTMSVTMRVDYRRREVKVFAGKSGSIRGRPAQGFVKCVNRSIPAPDWSGIEHQHTKYIIAVMATFPGR